MGRHHRADTIGHHGPTPRKVGEGEGEKEGSQGSHEDDEREGGEKESLREVFDEGIEKFKTRVTKFARDTFHRAVSIGSQQMHHGPSP